MVTLSKCQNSPDRGQSQKIRFSIFSGSGLKKSSELCVLPLVLGKASKMLPKPCFSKPTFGLSTGQLNWTGPIANSSENRDLGDLNLGVG